MAGAGAAGTVFRNGGLAMEDNAAGAGDEKKGFGAGEAAIDEGTLCSSMLFVRPGGNGALRSFSKSKASGTEVKEVNTWGTFLFFFFDASANRTSYYLLRMSTAWTSSSRLTLLSFQELVGQWWRTRQLMEFSTSRRTTMRFH